MKLWLVVAMVAMLVMPAGAQWVSEPMRMQSFCITNPDGTQTMGTMDTHTGQGSVVNLGRGQGSTIYQSPMGNSWTIQGDPLPPEGVFGMQQMQVVPEE